jgi:hypothetical protein
MPATNIQQIRAHQAAVQGAVTTLLTAAGVPAYRERSSEDLPDVFMWPIFTRGRASGHVARLPAASGKGYEYDIFPDSTITVEIFCPRVNKEAKTLIAVYDFLEELAVRSDDALSGFVGRDALNALLPYHTLDALIPGAEQRGYDEDRNIDRHTLTFTGILGIRPAAWPSDPAAYVLPEASG